MLIMDEYSLEEIMEKIQDLAYSSVDLEEFQESLEEFIDDLEYSLEDDDRTKRDTQLLIGTTVGIAGAGTAAYVASSALDQIKRAEPEAYENVKKVMRAAKSGRITPDQARSYSKQIRDLSEDLHREGKIGLPAKHWLDHLANNVVSAAKKAHRI